MINYKQTSLLIFILKLERQFIFINKMIDKVRYSNRSQEINKIIRIKQYSYRKRDLLGEGYSSKVYKGKNNMKSNFYTYQDQDVAIKIISKENFNNQINKTLLQAQISILQSMKNCNNILHVYDIIQEQKQIYIITQLCERDLSSRGNSKMSDFLFKKYVKEIIQGFKQLYQHQVIHRDLKPANLLINKNNQLKIADFGFAIKTKDAIKQSKYNIGSPLYMAPETLSRNQYSHKSDIWAIGIMLYELLTGQTPWKAENEEELIEKQQKIRIDEILEGKKILSLAKNLIQKALVYDKRKRMTESELINFVIEKQAQKEFLQKPLKLRVQNRVNIPYAMPKTVKNVEKKDKNEKKKYSNEQNKKQQINQTIKIQKLSREERKNITKMLIGQIHVCRLLFKILSKLQLSAKSGLLKGKLQAEKQNLCKCYANIIIKTIEKVKNIKSINFLYISQHHLHEYLKSEDFKKLMKICDEYQERYSKSAELVGFWHHSQQPSYHNSIKATINFIQLFWQQIRPNNKQQIILADYLLFTKNVLILLRKGSYRSFMEKTNIEEFVDKDTKGDKEAFMRLKQEVKQLSNNNQKGKTSRYSIS